MSYSTLSLAAAQCVCSNFYGFLFYRVFVFVVLGLRSSFSRVLVFVTPRVLHHFRIISSSAKFGENNRFVLENSKIITLKLHTDANQFGHDTDLNSTIIEHNRKAANENFDTGDIYTRPHALSDVSLSCKCRLFHFASAAYAELWTFLIYGRYSAGI